MHLFPMLPCSPSPLSPTNKKCCVLLRKQGKKWCGTVSWILTSAISLTVSRGTLYISQTSSSLDDLAGCIDPCPLDGSSCAGITASSELPTHLEIVNNSDLKAILHGHPKFSVIISMDCDRDDCLTRGLCHRRCPERRLLDDIPIVPGEVGTGPFGLCTTVPDAVLEACGAIVYGHGVFTTGKSDFNEAFSRLLTIENRSREEYFRRFDE